MSDPTVMLGNHPSTLSEESRKTLKRLHNQQGLEVRHYVPRECAHCSLGQTGTSASKLGNDKLVWLLDDGSIGQAYHKDCAKFQIPACPLGELIPRPRATRVHGPMEQLFWEGRVLHETPNGVKLGDIQPESIDGSDENRAPGILQDGTKEVWFFSMVLSEINTEGPGTTRYIHGHLTDSLVSKVEQWWPEGESVIPDDWFQKAWKAWDWLDACRNNGSLNAVSRDLEQEAISALNFPVLTFTTSLQDPKWLSRYGEHRGYRDYRIWRSHEDE